MKFASTFMNTNPIILKTNDPPGDKDKPTDNNQESDSSSNFSIDDRPYYDFST